MTWLRTECIFTSHQNRWESFVSIVIFTFMSPVTNKPRKQPSIWSIIVIIECFRSYTDASEFSVLKCCEHVSDPSLCEKRDALGRWILAEM